MYVCMCVGVCAYERECMRKLYRKLYSFTNIFTYTLIAVLDHRHAYFNTKSSISAMTVFKQIDLNYSFSLLLFLSSNSSDRKSKAIAKI